ncbi:hypothetical protein [Legionella sp. CNM-4043-24]|uniref:hypothetical protein n=1 Tax=Legionella sp. CNM-4043-24 TaxID=3421646 RepID=UPI00403A9BB8
MKKVIAVSMLAMAMNSHALNLISEVEANRFKNMSSSEIKPELYNKLIAFCDKTSSSIESCLQKIKSQTTDKNVIQSDMKYSSCCWNVSNQFGDYMFYQGNSYCIPACH